MPMILFFCEPSPMENCVPGDSYAFAYYETCDCRQAPFNELIGKTVRIRLNFFALAGDSFIDFCKG